MKFHNYFPSSTNNTTIGRNTTIEHSQLSSSYLTNLVYLCKGKGLHFTLAHQPHIAAYIRRCCELASQLRLFAHFCTQLFSLALVSLSLSLALLRTALLCYAPGPLHFACPAPLLISRLACSASSLIVRHLSPLPAGSTVSLHLSFDQRTKAITRFSQSALKVEL